MKLTLFIKSNEISNKNDFDGIEKFRDITDNNTIELKVWLNNYLDKIKEHLTNLSEGQACKTNTEKILFYCRLFEDKLLYNQLFDIKSN